MATGAIVDVVTGDRLPFQFDPPEVAGNDAAAWATIQVPGTSHVGAQFISGDDRGCTLQLQFSADEPGMTDVRRKIDWLRALTFPEYRDDELAGPPHPILVSYGPFFEGKKFRVMKVGWKFTHRDPESEEFREATVDLDLSEIGESTSFDEVRW